MDTHPLQAGEGWPLASVTQNPQPACVSELTPAALASGASPAVWLNRVLSVSSCVQSILSAAKSLHGFLWPRPLCPHHRCQRPSGSGGAVPGPRCARPLLASHAPCSAHSTQVYEHCSLLLCVHTHAHLCTYRPDHTHTRVCTVPTGACTHTHGSPLPLGRGWVPWEQAPCSVSFCVRTP